MFSLRFNRLAPDFYKAIQTLRSIFLWHESHRVADFLKAQAD